MKIKIFVFAVLISIITFNIACAFQFELISKEQEIQIGKDTAKELESKYGTVNNKTQLARINRIGFKVVSVCDRRDLPYSFKILNDSQINAVCCPGGFIYVTKGLMNLKLTDSELACILGHEITHAVKKHAVKQIEASMGIGVILDVLTKGQAGKNLGGQVAQMLISTGHSRDDEFDADLTGATYAFYAGYNPYGMIDFLELLNKLIGNKTTFLDQFIATHPPNNDRISRLRPLCKSLTGK